MIFYRVQWLSNLLSLKKSPLLFHICNFAQNSGLDLLFSILVTRFLSCEFVDLAEVCPYRTYGKSVHVRRKVSLQCGHDNVNDAMMKVVLH